MDFPLAHGFCVATGTLIGSYIRHPSAVRCFDFNYDHPDRIICGRSDGHITTWDTVSTLVIDDIKPDSDWLVLYRHIFCVDG